ncbi:MAG: PHP domain-containing protein, partial [Sulfurifustis sp.]
MTTAEPLPAYAELHAISNFSFLRGASHPEELVDRAHALGLSALALTDECSVAGCVRAHLQAQGRGLKLIIGSEFALADGPRIVLLAPDRAAYGNLSELITRGRRNAKKGAYHLTRADVAEFGGRCLALWLPDETPDTGALNWLRAMFAGRVWIVVERLFSGHDRARLAQLRALGERFGVPCVASGGVQMHKRSR